MHPNDDVINDYVDGALDAARRAEIERHLASCITCRQLADDLREIAQTAAALDDRVLPVRAWTRIERAIALEPAPAAKGGRSTYAWMAIAAAVLLAAAIGVQMARLGRQIPPTNAAVTGNGTTDTAASATAVETEMREAEQHYENAIKGLEQIAKADGGELDPRTAATLQKNLDVVDQAIGESRAAIRAQPASDSAQQSLMENFKTKVALLQDTVALINEMRKGNDSGAARIVSGLKTKGD